MYISHNLGVIARVSDRVAVMYAGEMVERAPVTDIYLQPAPPLHPGADALRAPVGPGQDRAAICYPSRAACPPRRACRPAASLSRAAALPGQMQPGTAGAARGNGTGHWVRCLFAEEVVEQPLEPAEDQIPGVTLLAGQAAAHEADPDARARPEPTTGAPSKRSLAGREAIRQGGGRGESGGQARSDAGHRGRIRLRQEHAGQDDHRAGAADRRQDRVHGRGHRRRRSPNAA